MKAAERRSVHHRDNLRINLLGQDASTRCDVLKHLVESLSLDGLALQVRAGVVKVEDSRALSKLSDEEFSSIRRVDLCEPEEKKNDQHAFRAMGCRLTTSRWLQRRPSSWAGERTRGKGKQDGPLNPGSFSKLAPSVTWNLELLCFRGPFTARGMMSFDPSRRRRPSWPERGAPPGIPPDPAPSPLCLLGGSTAISDEDETSTVGGAGDGERR